MPLKAEPNRPTYQKKRRKKRKSRDEWTKTDWIEKAAWPIFSRYIRLRDCLETTGTRQYGKCVTCGKKYPFGKLQAGHFVPGRSDTVLFDEEAVHAQCYRCNVVLAGMWPAYYRFMQERHGQDWIEDRIDRWEADAETLTIPRLQAIEKYYLMEYEALAGE